MLSLLCAVVLETLLPDRTFDPSKHKIDRISQEFELDVAALGAPRQAWLQWWAPVLVWLLLVQLAYGLLAGYSTFAAGALLVLVLLYALRFKHFTVVLTSTQLFLNQGDFFRARELVLNWVRQVDLRQHVLHNPAELLMFALSHAVTRALRQYFGVVFWFLLVPGPVGLVAYVMVVWSVERDAQRWLESGLSHGERPSMAQERAELGWKVWLSPRFVLYAMEWLPARLLAITVGLLTQLDDMTLAWRAAKRHSKLSNRAPLAAVCLNAIGVLPVGQKVVNANPEDPPIMALQAFRQLMFKCAVVWLLLGLLLAFLFH